MPIDLHPLALEDVLHQRGHARSKSDYYHQHLFLRVLCHTLAANQDGIAGGSETTVTDLPRSNSPGPMSMEDEKAMNGGGGMDDSDDDRTMFGGSEPPSRISTKGRAGIVKRRPWGAGWGGSWGGDVENAPAYEAKARLPRVPRGSTVSRRLVAVL